ncbi:hypothetical protein NVP2275O_204 [Vibrio phage 2.275.O._10N.286.54.E11]|nr:hypothetical protein NVP2275O_204 [Vibrio phage 2.275.O._10N.286.54.E11]
MAAKCAVTGKSLGSIDAILLETEPEKYVSAVKGVKKEKVECRYCGMKVEKHIINRFHDENCPNKQLMLSSLFEW